MLQYLTLTPSYANSSYAMFSGQSRGRISEYCCNIIQEEALQINSELFRTGTLNYLQTKLLLCNTNSLQVKPCGIGSRLRVVEAFLYKTEIKII